jgi:hypothetical protein
MRASATVVFRTALVVRLALGIVGTLGARALYMRTTSSLPPTAAFALDAVLWGIDFAAAAGMWYFRRWARILYIVLIALFVISLLVRPGPLVGSTTFFGLYIIQNILDGVVITMALLPPLAGLFAKRKA